ncbi:alanine racemase [Natronomonas halophila]|uniref:alanine racemase n=1 Tax=Natronomonas halophila TaxID=2747817 RepID=UPI0015B5CFAA|nr:alanine racemase [Natronomonas halophila]QLD85991.1 alanine racemase [Natronomonas halophila]
MQPYGAYRAAFADRSLPTAFLDRRAFEANVERTAERADGVPVRIASKSVRCRAVLERLLDEPDFEGLMCYTGDEAADLAAAGFDDLLVAYPTVDEGELRRVAETVADGARIVLMVDSTEHVERIGAVASDVGADVPLCIDLDLSTEHLGIYFGVQRSPIRTPEQATSVADVIAETEGVHLSGLMGYEAQLAGLPDRNPANNPAKNAIIRRLKERSKPIVRERRQAVAEALDDEYGLAFVNGGGTGSIEFTRQDPWVTEVTAGSAFYAPRQFDWYDEFAYEPAAGYAVEVTREPDSGVYTCRGGGYVASGPVGEDKAPIPWLPEGATLRDDEGAGEVQTPVLYDGDLSVGDPVVMRHGKAGELCRFFEELAVVDGEEIVDVWPTYRGEGKCYI